MGTCYYIPYLLWLLANLQSNPKPSRYEFIYVYKGILNNSDHMMYLLFVSIALLLCTVLNEKKEKRAITSHLSNRFNFILFGNVRNY